MRWKKSFNNPVRGTAEIEHQSCIWNILRVQSTKCDFSQFIIYFCKTLYMFQTGFSVHHQELKNCTYSVRHLSDQYCYLLLARPGCMCSFWAPDDGRKNHLKHVDRLTEINKLRKAASCWLYSEIVFAMHGPMNVKLYVKIMSCYLRRLTLHCQFSFTKITLK